MGLFLIVTSGSRSGILALLPCIAIFGWREGRQLLGRRFGRVLGALGIAMVGAAAVLWLPGELGYGRSIVGEVVKRTAEDWKTRGVSEGSIGGRILGQVKSLEIWLVNPILGAGKGSVRWGSHGQLADSLAEMGVLGGFGVLAFYVFLYRHGVRKLRLLRRAVLPQEVAILAASAPALFAMWLVFSMTYGYWYQPFYILIPAMLVAIGRENRRPSSSLAPRQDGQGPRNGVEL
jgi:O-antigen ligase